MSGTGIGRDTSQIFVGQDAVIQRGEGNASHAFFLQHLCQTLLGGADHHGIFGLMDKHGGAHFPERFDGSSGLFGIVIGDAHIQRLAAADDLVQCTHGFLNGGIRIRAVMVKNVHMIQMHPLQRLLQTGDQIFAAAVVAIGPGPHIVTGLGGNHQLMAVGVPVPIHVDAEITLCLSVGRPIIICQVKMGNAKVKALAKDALLGGKGCDVSEVVPQSQGKRRQHQTASSAAPVGDLFVSIESRLIVHNVPP